MFMLSNAELAKNRLAAIAGHGVLLYRCHLLLWCDTIRVPKLPDAGIASCEHLRQEAIRACSNHTLDRRRCCTRLNKVDHARVILR